jgi:indolepyruvate decarboxylase
MACSISPHIEKESLQANHPNTCQEDTAELQIAHSNTVGSYLAACLSQIGLKHHFAVAGDFNLVLLDELLKNKELEQVYCCNELNCGYAEEGYARACGAAAAVVTFSVGGLSAMNAIGGAYAENLPVILVSCAPNTNDRATEHFIHHTLVTTIICISWR